MKKRIFSLFMVFTLCFINVNQVHADAGSLIIAGGSVAGVTAGAIAGPAVVAVFCAMMAFGMNVELTQASEEAGMTKTEFLKNKIQQYCNEAKISANTFNNYILDQAQVLQNGTISITDQASKQIEKFCNWLFASDQVSDDAFTGQTVSILGKTCPVVRVGDQGLLMNYDYGNDHSIWNYKYSEGVIPMVLIRCMDVAPYTEIYAVTKQAISSGDVVFQVLDAESGIVNQTNSNVTEHNGYYYVRVFGSGDRYFTYSTSIPVFEGLQVNEVLDQITSWPIPEGSVSNADTITGDQSEYDVSKGVLNPTQDQTVVINPHITIPVPTDKDVTIDINEYLDIIQDLIDGVADDIITAIDDATDVPITIEFDPTQDWDPTIEKEDDTDLPPDDEKTPVVKDDIIPHDFDPDPMKFDLKGIFPFCIPWDVKDMLSKLSADPVAPSYTVNWMIPIVNERLIFTVDLSPFNGVAQVCRTMELLAFCIGLAVVTRQLFLRG